MAEGWLKAGRCVVSAVEEAGALLRDIFRSRAREHRLKGERDFITRADLQSEKIILDVITVHFPHHSFFAEEAGQQGRGSKYCWIVDPLCSTNNFVFGLPMYGIAVALTRGDEFLYGVIHVPEFDATVVAERSRGAFLGGKRIHVASQKSLSDTLVMYDNQFHRATRIPENLLQIWPKVFTVRISGSAAYDNFLVATGVAAARIFHATKLVDFAAAAVIVEEAGGRVTDFEGNPVTRESTSVLVSNGQIHRELLTLLRRSAK